MSNTSSYNNHNAAMGEVEYPVADPASGAFFQPDFKKNDDLKMMLDSSKNSLKLEAMKRIIGMIAKGRDASELFPAVVKNVVSKNIEVKKLVYVYLVRYAEEQQDLALLSISTFQRALKDPNQLIRGSAMRVLSSIRVNMIVPIVMLAIRDCSSDMSPYVRKTAAHAIPKLYSLDPEQKEELVGIIHKLLSDKAPLVVGSAAMAFMEVCPERMSMIHSNFRRICSMLVDVDEWGQLVLLNMLTVYAKMFFPNPNSEDYVSESEDEKPFYDDSDSDNTNNSNDKKKKPRTPSSPALDADHKTLLRAARPLLQSRNASVVMAVAQLYYHCAPAGDLPPVAKAMIRLLRAPIEVQSIVLHYIASLTISKRALFEPFLKSFFVRMSDPTHIKLLKLEILTNLATETSAPIVLREFQTYVTSNDKSFAGATIQAIGRLATSIESVTETCLNGLLHLLSSKDEWIVCEAVVVVKRVVSGGASSAKAAVSRAAKLLISNRLGGNARAAAVWLIAEHGVRHPRAPVILAHMILKQDFSEQEELVKLQLLTLAIKLTIAQPETLPLARYVLTLARYDPNYDVRDRARMLRKFIEPEEREKCQLLKHAEAIFLAEKPTPVMESKFKDRQQYTLGSLSHVVGHRAAGYVPLPDTHVPRVLDTHDTDTNTHNHNTVEKGFYSEPGSSGPSTSGSSTSSGESSDSSGDEDEESDKAVKSSGKTRIVNKNNFKSSSGTEDSESDSESSSGSQSDTESNTESDTTTNKTNKKEEKPAPKPENKTAKNEKSNLELLLELDDAANTLPTMTPTFGGFLSPSVSTNNSSVSEEWCAPKFVSTTGQELFSRVCAHGLSAVRRWTRAQHLYSPTMLAVELAFTNHTQEEVTNIRLHKKTLTGARAIHDFAPISVLLPTNTATTTLGIDFADTIQPVEFTIKSNLGEISASITAPIGELIRAITMAESRWDTEQKKLRGMTECDKKVKIPGDEKAICERVYITANVGPIVTAGNHLKFSGRLMHSQELVLLSIIINDSEAIVRTNCSNMAVASLLTNELAQVF